MSKSKTAKSLDPTKRLADILDRAEELGHTPGEFKQNRPSPGKDGKIKVEDVVSIAQCSKCLGLLILRHDGSAFGTVFQYPCDPNSLDKATRPVVATRKA